MRRIWIFVGAVMLGYMLVGSTLFVMGCRKDERTKDDTHAGHDRHLHEKQTPGEPSAEEPGLCLVMPGERASTEHSYLYKGTTYYFCCKGCVAEFKKSPDKYIAKIKEINLESYQYGFSPDPVVVKKGDIVRLTLTTRDVAHGIYIGEYGVKVSAKKGEKNKVEFHADKAGEFDIICSVYCGPGHSRMRGKLIVEE